MNGTDVILIGLTITVLTLLAVKFIAGPCSIKTEAFQDSSPNTMKCPRGTKSFTNKDGNIQCCRGEVTGNKCEGKVACKISASADNIPFCKAGFQKKWDGEIPQFIKDVVKNMSLMNNFSYSKLLADLTWGYNYLMTGGYKYKINEEILNGCSLKTDVDNMNNYAKKEIGWFQIFIKDINNGNYSKAEIDEILEDFFAYIYFTFPSIFMPYITKLETCMQLKKLQPTK
jgi:hypothetical protein